MQAAHGLAVLTVVLVGIANLADHGSCQYGLADSNTRADGFNLDQIAGGTANRDDFAVHDLASKPNPTSHPSENWFAQVGTIVNPAMPGRIVAARLQITALQLRVDQGSDQHVSSSCRPCRRLGRPGSARHEAEQQGSGNDRSGSASEAVHGATLARSAHTFNPVDKNCG